MRETTDDRRILDLLERMERRQQALIQAVGAAVEVGRINTAMLTDLMKWLREPPSSDLSDLVKELVARQDATHAEVLLVPAKVVEALDR